jgi:hypothetical protein
MVNQNRKYCSRDCYAQSQRKLRGA